MSEQFWNFPIIAAKSQEILQTGATMESLLGEAEQAATNLNANWEGQSSEARDAEQRSWHEETELAKSATSALGRAVGEAGTAMGQNEQEIASLF